MYFLSSIIVSAVQNPAEATRCTKSTLVHNILKTWAFEKQTHYFEIFFQSVVPKRVGPKKEFHHPLLSNSDKQAKYLHLHLLHHLSVCGAKNGAKCAEINKERRLWYFPAPVFSFTRVVDATTVIELKDGLGENGHTLKRVDLQQETMNEGFDRMASYNVLMLVVTGPLTPQTVVSCMILIPFHLYRSRYPEIHLSVWSENNSHLRSSVPSSHLCLNAASESAYSYDTPIDLLLYILFHPSLQKEVSDSQLGSF